MKLSRRVFELIRTKLGSSFDALKSKLLVISGYSKFNLPGIYMESVKESGGTPDLDTLQSLVDTTSNYLDSVKLNSIDKSLKQVEAYLQAERNAKPESVEKILRDSWKDVVNKVQQIVETEATSFRNMGSLEGIIRVASSKNIKDPNIAFITSKDTSVCEECVQLHTIDGLIPRVFKLSEVSHGYHIKGSDIPSVYGIHPMCRCTMIIILPNYGFKNGRLSYISDGYDAFEEQYK